MSSTPRRGSAGRHAFLDRPNRTLIGLSFPVLLSLIAEPITGLVDTAFVARLGDDALAGLGVGAIALSAAYWLFNFLGIGTQTEIAAALGRDQDSGPGSPQAIAGLALRVALVSGLGIAVVGFLLTPPLARALGASGAIEDAAVTYMAIRWAGAPAMLVIIAGFGALRGIQEMRAPLWIAVGMNALNAAGDGALIFGLGPFPELGIAGAAWASTGSQWIGAIVVVVAVRRHLGWSSRADWTGAGRLFRIGGDIVIRTGMLTLFLLIATRAATRIGAEAGAAHQGIRQVWIFTALFLDAWAITAQSLVGYFLGAFMRDAARQVARLAAIWSLVTGLVLALSLAVATPWVEYAVVPPGAVEAFRSAWWWALAFLPVSGLAFATDGVHWGTGDFAFLRTATTIATVIASAMLVLVGVIDDQTLARIWAVTGLWLVLRSAFGLLRVWPGIGAAPLAHD